MTWWRLVAVLLVVSVSAVGAQDVSNAPSPERWLGCWRTVLGEYAPVIEKRFMAALPAELEFTGSAVPDSLTRTRRLRLTPGPAWLVTVVSPDTLEQPFRTGYFRVVSRDSVEVTWAGLLVRVGARGDSLVGQVEASTDSGPPFRWVAPVVLQRTSCS